MMHRVDLTVSDRFHAVKLNPGKHLYMAVSFNCTIVVFQILMAFMLLSGQRSLPLHVTSLVQLAFNGDQAPVTAWQVEICVTLFLSKGFRLSPELQV